MRASRLGEPWLLWLLLSGALSDSRWGELHSGGVDVPLRLNSELFVLVTDLLGEFTATSDLLMGPMLAFCALFLLSAAAEPFCCTLATALTLVSLAGDLVWSEDGAGEALLSRLSLAALLGLALSSPSPPCLLLLLRDLDLRSGSGDTETVIIKQ